MLASKITHKRPRFKDVINIHDDINRCDGIIVHEHLRDSFFVVFHFIDVKLFSQCSSLQYPNGLRETKSFICRFEKKQI